MLDTNSPSMAVTTNRLASSAWPPAPPAKDTSASAAISTPPVRSRASEKGIMPAIRTRLFQWIEP